MKTSLQQRSVLGTAVFGILVVTRSGFASAARTSLSGDNAPETYTSWLSGDGRNYKSNQFMGKNNEYALHWTIDDNKNEIHLAASVSATGWIAFGLSEAGGMKGADMFVYTAKTNDVLDMYSTEYARPIEDACHDWKLKNATVDDTDGVIIVEVSRAFDTGDKQDLPFFDDSSQGVASHRVIAAWGDEEKLSYHSTDDVALGIVRFFRQPTNHDDSILIEDKGIDSSVALVNAEDDGQFSIELRAPDDYVIPTNQTTYEDFCFDKEQSKALGLDLSIKTHFVGAEYLEGGNEEFVHHIVLSGYGEGETCERAFRPVWVWAPGDEDVSLPDNVGLPFGSTDGMIGFKMEVHYNNPDMIEGKLNRSGGRLTFTTNLREHEAAPMILGDPFLGLYGEPIGKGWSRWDFNCPSSCTDTYLTEEVTVFRNWLHMHEAGERMVFKQYSEDGQMKQQEHVDNYDFTQAGGYLVPKPSFKVSPGDSFDVVCYYNEKPFDDNRAFGLASYDEMCMAFLWYYPRIPTFPGICGPNIEDFVPNCGSNYTYTELEGPTDTGRTFGNAPDDGATCQALVEEAAPTAANRDDSSASQAKTFVGFLASIMVGLTYLLF